MTSVTVGTAYPKHVAAPGATFAERLRWIDEQRPALETQLLEPGAILFTGLGAETSEIFESLSGLFFQDVLRYVGGDSPRKRVGTRAYTSTEYPPQYAISQHNEMSYASSWPSQLLFCCIVAAEEGGETPIADNRKVTQALDPSILDEFARRGVRYIRNLPSGAGFGRSWQDTFETEDRTAVEQFCAETATEFEWKSDGGLRLIQRRDALAQHPVTGDRLWFNQAEQFHPSSLENETHDALMDLYEDDLMELPSYATFGDAGTIPEEMLEHVRHVTAGHIVRFPWKPGDVLWIDNMLASHGRMPYRGNRRILVSMG